MKQHLFRAMIVAFGFLIPSHGVVGKPIPYADLFEAVPAHSFTLSPDGETLAFIGLNAEERMALFARNIESGEIQSWIGYGDVSMLVDYFWISPERLVYQTAGPGGARESLRDYIGVYSVKRDSSKVTKLNGKRERMFLLDPLVGRESFIVARNLGVIGEKSPVTFSEIDGVKGKKLRILATFTRDPGIRRRNNHIFLDPSGELRVLLTDEKEPSQWTYRSSPDAEWIPLGSFEEFRVLGLDPSGNGALVTGHFDQDRAGLYRYDLEKQSVGSLVFRDPIYDLRLSAHLFNDVRGQPLGLRYSTDRLRTIWFSADMQQIQQILDKQHPDTLNNIVSANLEVGRFLFRSYSDRQPSVYRLLDYQARKISDIWSTQPKIDPETTAPTESVSFTSRDGLSLHGYLTLPISGKPPFPSIALVHGGPWLRDTWGFDPEVQFLVSRGYAVLRVNFRGSTGYGNAISETPKGDFKDMNNDIEDGIRWAIEQGHADPDRIGIMGTSFGGFAALYGVAFKPDLYKCAVGNAGVYDWPAVVRARKRQNEKAYLELIEIWGEDYEEILAPLSPINHVEKIKAPVLIAFGRQDSNVEPIQSKRMISAMRKKGWDPEVFARHWEGHGFSNDQVRADYHQKLEAFLKKNL